MLAAGKLPHRIEIQASVVTQGVAAGQPIKSWVKVDDVWAGYSPASVREFQQSKALQSEFTGVFTIRYRTDVNSQCRILWRNKIYNISGVMEDSDSALEYLRIPVTEGVNDG